MTLRVCVIASSRFPVSEPFAGGLEAHTHSLARALSARGHEVSLFAAEGSDPGIALTALAVERFLPSPVARRDLAASPDQWMQEHHAYLSLMLDLSATAHRRFDVVHNNSLHHLPVAMAAAVRVPTVTTLHTPPTPWLESAIRLAHPTAEFAAVSAFTARQWSASVNARVIRNGVDTTRWAPGPGGESAVWFGRLVPEKAPHLAIDAARLAGMELTLAGPLLDRGYFDAQIRPRLAEDARYLGHLDTARLAHLVGHSAVTVVTPRWDEPSGLVAAESMSCGTPVAAFERGGLPESISVDSGRLAAADDVGALAVAISQAARLPRTRTRAHALRHCSLGAMVDAYERLYAGSAELAA